MTKQNETEIHPSKPSEIAFGVKDGDHSYSENLWMFYFFVSGLKGGNHTFENTKVGLKYPY